jgi:biotin carboxyl carrier protein
MLQMAVIHDRSPWEIVSLNHINQPYRPLLFKPIFLNGGSEPPKQYPAGFNSLQLSQTPAHPGQGLAIRAHLAEDLAVSASYTNVPFDTFIQDHRLVGLFGTGAFFNPGDHELTIRSLGKPLWSQPYRMLPGEWTFEEITLIGEAAAIDAESIRIERERLMAIWSEHSAEPLWQNPFSVPILDYLAESSRFGARRSYNGGPYSSYHEGVDYSAYAGTAVYAPAGGTIVLAEQLFVRGGAVIIDHGFGIFSGFYHLSEVLAEVGQTVYQGQTIGRVGTTGLSTGNHLHWDLLVSGTWVDGNAWLQSDTACWLLEGWGKPCSDS